MLKIDVGNMAFTAAIASLVCALIITAYGSSLHRDRRWGAFALAAALHGVGVLLIVFRDFVPPAVAVIGGNLLVVLSAVAAHVGVRVLIGEPERPWAIYSAVVVLFLAGQCYFYYVNSDVNLRIAMVSMARVPIYGLAAAELIGYRRNSADRGIGALLCVFFVWAVLLVLRSAHAVWDEAAIHDFVSLVGLQAFFSAVPALGFVVITMALAQIDLSRLGQALGDQHDVNLEPLETRIARQSDLRALFEAMLNASTDAIMLAKADGTLWGANVDLARRIRRTASDLVGTSLWDLFPAPVAKVRRDATRQALETGMPVKLIDRRGELWLDNTIYPVVAEIDGKCDKVAIYSRDITAEKLGEQKIAAYTAELERSNADLEHFAYVTSHDLREPLRMVSSYLKLLERRLTGSLDKECREFIEFAVDGAKRMDIMVTGLLEYSRIGRSEKPAELVSLADTIADALANLGMAVSSSGAVVEVTAKLPKLRGDPVDLLRLFQNLIGNAVKYVAPGTTPRIRIGCDGDEEAWLISITDNGIGIPVDATAKIFELFQRAVGRNEYEGCGIGLAISRRIVEGLGGTIWVEPHNGGGSRFILRLPKALSM